MSVEKREFVNGGPLDGEVLPCLSDTVRVASRRGVIDMFHQGASPDLVHRVPHHVYQVGTECCPEGCCSRIVMIYLGQQNGDI